MCDRTLSEEQRADVLSEVYRALWSAAPELFSERSDGEQTGIEEIDAHLDDLVNLIGVLPVARVEQHLPAVMAQHVCSRCVLHRTGGECSLRRHGSCALYDNGIVVVEAVAGALSQMNDPSIPPA